MRIAAAIAASIIAGLLLTASTPAAPGRATATAAAHKATRATFAGRWFGHTRSLKIGPKGHAREAIGDGCCNPVISLRFRLWHVRGTTNRATARARVTAVHVHDHSYYSEAHPPPHVGERRHLRLRNGVIKEPFTHTNYCDRKAGLKGICGA
jgi:hypothetical protein